MLSRRIFQGLVFTFPALLLIVVYVGDFHRDPSHTTPVFFGLLGMWALGCRFLEASRPDERGVIERGLWARGETAWWIRGAAIAAAALIYILLSDRTYQRMRLFPDQGDGVMAAVWLSAGLLAILLARPPRLYVSLGLLVLAGLIVRACGLWQWEISPARRDMLALVISAVDAFLSGDNPYGFHQMQVGSSVPLTYPPGLWLSHLPARVLDLDIRWTGVLADGAAAAVLGGIAVRKRSALVGPVFLALAVYLFSPDIHWNGIYAEPNLDWAVLAFLSAAVISRRTLPIGVAMGFALTTRPFNLILLPFLIVWLVRAFGLRTAWRTLLVSGLVAAIFYVPFVMWDPDAFYAGTVRWLLDYGPAHNKWFWGMMGVSGQLYKHGHADWLLPLQLGSVGLLLGFAAWRLRTERGLLAFWALAYAFFVAFNSIIWMSFWIGVCVIAIAGTAASGAWEGTSGAGPGRLHTARGPLVLTGELVAATAVALSAFLLAFNLHAHFSRDGLKEARGALEARARQGDMILDLTGWRVSFMKTPWVLDRPRVPHGAILAGDPYTARWPRRGDMDPASFERILVVERYGLFDGYDEIFLGEGGDGPFEVASDRLMGEYRLKVLERSATGSAGRMSRRPEGLKVSALEEGGIEREAVWKNGAWRWPGKRGGWRKVSRQTVKIGGVKRTMLWAHPWGGASKIEISWDTGGAGRWLLVSGGLRDRSAQWGRSPVRVEVEVDGEAVGSRLFPNARGVSGFSTRLPDGAREITLLVSARDSARRHFFLDAETLR